MLHLIKGRKLLYVRTHQIILAIPKTKFFVNRWQRPQEMFDKTQAFVGASDIIVPCTCSFHMLMIRMGFVKYFYHTVHKENTQ